ncbi:hypothetical protein [Amycolatopsis magusensis]|nr:hypothetical protein [Amycolatopsis magusensis]MDI5975892.1 hypothetical protein [Amycolatopsis magusensis]
MPALGWIALALLAAGGLLLAAGTVLIAVPLNRTSAPVGAEGPLAR